MLVLIKYIPKGLLQQSFEFEIFILEFYVSFKTDCTSHYIMNNYISYISMNDHSECIVIKIRNIYSIMVATNKSILLPSYFFLFFFFLNHVCSFACTSVDHLTSASVIV